jgi:hypothetical protein
MVVVVVVGEVVVVVGEVVVVVVVVEAVAAAPQLQGLVLAAVLVVTAGMAVVVSAGLVVRQVPSEPDSLMPWTQTHKPCRPFSPLTTSSWTMGCQLHPLSLRQSLLQHQPPQPPLSRPLLSRRLQPLVLQPPPLLPRLLSPVPQTPLGIPSGRHGRTSTAA